MRSLLVIILVLAMVMIAPITVWPLPATAAFSNTTSPSSTKRPAVVPVNSTLPVITLNNHDFYFRVENKQNLVFSRNIAAYHMDDFNILMPMVKSGGSKVVRLQVSTIVAGGMGYTNAGTVDEAWARKWEKVFDTAEANGIYLWIVFTGWYDWNTTGYNDWAKNPFNITNGGPASEPVELFKRDSLTQVLWLKWLRSIVKRWQGQKNILAWESYSEVNLTKGVYEENGIYFIERAAAIIHEADKDHRPHTASLADIGEWSRFYQSNAIDFINIHPYPPSGQLDRKIINDVHMLLNKYNKPVVIGESGLSAETPDTRPATLTTADKAELGIKHAIWAEVVSGAMNGRALYWEDGYGIYFPALSWSFLNKYADVELSAAKFVEDVDFTGFEPLPVSAGTKLVGAAVGNAISVIGWFRDASCEPPLWNLQPNISNQSVVIKISGSTPTWKVDFYSTKTGTVVVSSRVIRKGNTIKIALPDFTDDIAFKMYPEE